MTAPEPSDAPRGRPSAASSQSSRPSARPPGGRRGTPVVDEHHAVTDEHPVPDRDAVADEGVALHLAALADHRAALDLDERADLSPVADRAAVEVREGPDDHVVAERRRRRCSRYGASFAGASATEERLHRRATASSCSSVIPGKIGSERHSRPSASVTGNDPVRIAEEAYAPLRCGGTG